MNRRVRDILASLFVVAGIGSVLVVYYWFSGRLSSGSEESCLVRFNEVSGLRVGDPVEVLGVSAGRVGAVTLERCSVLVELRLRRERFPNGLGLPRDSRFAVRSVSYLGSDRFVAITPGSGPPAEPGFVFSGDNEALDLERTLAKLDALLAQLDVEAMTQELRSLTAEVTSSVRQALPALDSDMKRVAGELNRIAQGVDTLQHLLRAPSTVRKLLESEELYNELVKTNTELRALLVDIRENPSRYFSLRLR